MNFEVLADEGLDVVSGGSLLAVAIVALSITIWLADNQTDLQSGWDAGKAAANS